MSELDNQRKFQINTTMNWLRKRVFPTNTSNNFTPFTIGELSDVGRKRTTNQDAVSHIHLANNGLLAIVCDGMGGYSGGEVASEITTQATIDYFQNKKITPWDKPFHHLHQSFREASRQIWEHKRKYPKQNQMGTTAVALLCIDEFAYIAHIGDSRLYLLRDDTLIRITKDHSMIQDLIDQGKLLEKDANEHPQANVISRVLGRFEEPDIEYQPRAIHLQKNDRFLLCSDGLLRMVSDEKILYYLQHYTDPQLASEELLEVANQMGGKDNITIQIIDYQPSSYKTFFYTWAITLSILILSLLSWNWKNPPQKKITKTSNYQVVNSTNKHSSKTTSHHYQEKYKILSPKKDNKILTKSQSIKLKDPTKEDIPYPPPFIPIKKNSQILAYSKSNLSPKNKTQKSLTQQKKASPHKKKKHRKKRRKHRRRRRKHRRRRRRYRRRRRKYRRRRRRRRRRRKKYRRRRKRYHRIRKRPHRRKKHR